MNRRAGFTLIEVIVAGGLLAIGMLGLITLQAQSLRAQRRVALVRQLVAVAEAELDRRLATSAPVGGDCLTTGSTSLTSCIVDVVGCDVSDDGVCQYTDSESALRVVVEVEKAGQDFVLAAVHRRFGGR